MTITIVSTTKTVELNGTPCRVWEGATDTGIKVHAMIALVGVDVGEDQTEFEAELKECRPPSAAVQEIPLRMVL